MPEGTPGWLVLAAVIIVGLKYLFQFLSEMSESAARFFGPLGRKWRDRAEVRQQARQREDSGRAEALNDDLAYFQERASKADQRADAAESRASHMLDWYQEVDQRFHRELRIRAAESGCEMPPWTPLSQYRTPDLEEQQ
ncbi:membrane protein [Gordonia phage Lilbeanie]|uniref:Membrane protein n=1 Tax=Gordonia phage Lilbeanie TaxID=2794947 RepID=A0A7T1NW99_9CAUD|nr:membrane protein [Gordonia phage Lilbeanie]QPO17121.1 membrane protein [Gordonia phage Lilbeanie]